MHVLRPFVRLFAVSLSFAACADSTPPAAATDDLPLGDVEGDVKADGDGWGSALDCKTIPDLPTLVAPNITVSLQGLTLHLVDTASGYDRVFPIGPGRIDQDETDMEYGESLSYEPVLKYKTGDFAITPQGSVACKTWWTDPDTGEKSPVFAGLPFMSWSGNYGIHGPIDNFRADNGGTLRRGFVSHGCVRMEAADVLEVYARIHTVARVPVHVQRAAERRADGSVVDIANKWVGDACQADSECNFDGGFCAKNHVGGGGFCSAHCTQYCADRAAMPPTFCVADPDHAGLGMCVPKAVDQNFECRPYDSFAAETVPRFNQPSVSANACVPHSAGWIGDHCTGPSDCTNGTTCSAGVCTMACTSVCPDQPGWADTFCSAAGACVRACTPASNGSECPVDMSCAPIAHAGGDARYACVAEGLTTH